MTTGCILALAKNSKMNPAYFDSPASSYHNSNIDIQQWTVWWTLANNLNNITFHRNTRKTPHNKISLGVTSDAAHCQKHVETIGTGPGWSAAHHLSLTCALAFCACFITWCSWNTISASASMFLLRACISVHLLTSTGQTEEERNNTRCTV